MHKMYFSHVLYISKDITILAYHLCYEIMQKYTVRVRLTHKDFAICSQEVMT